MTRRDVLPAVTGAGLAAAGLVLLPDILRLLVAVAEALP